MAYQGARSADAPPNDQCRMLTMAIEGAVKEMSLIVAGGLGDNSAPRATMRASQIANKQSEIQTNILLMNANMCPPYTGPLHQASYLISAAECSLAMMRDRLAARGATPRATGTEKPTAIACDRSEWVPLQRGAK